MLAFFHFKHTLNILLFNYIKLYWYQNSSSWKIRGGQKRPSLLGLIKGVSKTIENELQEQGMWLGTLSLLGNLLTGEEVVAVGVGVIRESEGTISAIQDF